MLTLDMCSNGSLPNLDYAIGAGHKKRGTTCLLWRLGYYLTWSKRQTIELAGSEYSRLY